MPTLEQQEISLLKGRISRLEARLEFLYNISASLSLKTRTQTTIQKLSRL